MGRTARVSSHFCWTPVTNTKVTITTVIVTVASRTHHGCVVVDVSVRWEKVTHLTTGTRRPEGLRNAPESENKA